MRLELRCRRCGRLYRPTGDDLRAGRPHYWYCGGCRKSESTPAPKQPQSERPR